MQLQSQYFHWNPVVILLLSWANGKGMEAKLASIQIGKKPHYVRESSMNKDRKGEEGGTESSHNRQYKHVKLRRH